MNYITDKRHVELLESPSLGLPRVPRTSLTMGVVWRDHTYDGASMMQQQQSNNNPHPVTYLFGYGSTTALVEETLPILSAVAQPAAFIKYTPATAVTTTTTTTSTGASSNAAGGGRGGGGADDVPEWLEEHNYNERVRVLYTISSCATRQLIGKVIQTKRGISFQYITYEFQMQNQTVAMVWYKVPSLYRLVRDDPVREVMMTFTSDESEEFITACRQSLQSTGSLTNVPNVLQHKQPYVKKNGRYGLNFHGRGQGSSSKNVQLALPDGSVVCQFVKWDDERFHLDFRDPLSPVMALMFALVQIHL